MTSPKWLAQPFGLSQSALTYWKRYAKDCVHAETLTNENAMQFALLCELLAAIRAASVEIQREGATITAASGAKRANPAINSLISLQKTAAPLLREFGLASRWQY
jgi:phage terminase small subunit